MEASPLNRSLSQRKGVKMSIVAFRGEISCPPRAPACRARGTSGRLGAAAISLCAFQYQASPV